MNKKEVAGVVFVVLGFFVGRALVHEEPNSKAVYANGLPVNCRALVQANIDGWRAGHYKPDEIIASLERNCGAYGALWGIEE